MPGQINKVSRITSRFEGNSMSFLEEDYLDEDILDILLELLPKTQDSQIYQHHDIVTLSFKNARVKSGRS